MLAGVSRLLLKLSILSAMLLVLPLLGVHFAGKPLAPYLSMPPRNDLVSHAPFSAMIFTLTSVAAALALWIPLKLLRRDLAQRAFSTGISRSFPWWGWLGLALTIASWVVAWSDYPLFSDIRRFVFPTLWLGYVITINGLIHALGGEAPLRRRPWFFAALFPLSALFWWYFEYLNRFVQNWQYLGIADLGGFAYALHATLAYATVLPAVLSTAEWLYTLLRPVPNGPRLQLPAGSRRAAAWATLLIAAVAVTLLGVWPNALYSLLWVAPLLVLLALQTLLRERTVLHDLPRGDWRALYLPALAALQCGWFWEMWNQYSEAKWVYSIPYVHRFEIFEMPLLGYAGYLPFGIECAAVAAMLGPAFSFQRESAQA